MSIPIICPLCHGEIFSSAKKCQHCGEWLTSDELQEEIRMLEQDSIAHDENYKQEMAKAEENYNTSVFFQAVAFAAVMGAIAYFIAEESIGWTIGASIIGFLIFIAKTNTFSEEAAGKSSNNNINVTIVNESPNEEPGNFDV